MYTYMYMYMYIYMHALVVFRHSMYPALSCWIR